MKTCIQILHGRNKTKGKTYKQKTTTKKKKKKNFKILVGFNLRTTVWKPHALSTKPSQTTRFL